MDASSAASTAHESLDLSRLVVLLTAGVVAVPIFKRLGLGAVLGYIAAGLVIGPFGLGLITDSVAIMHIAELGVVMFLFVVGLEMEPKKLWSLRKEIFGLGVLQVVAASAALTVVGVALGYSALVSFTFGVGFVLTSTAIVMQVLAERNLLGAPAGEKMVSILLLEDLAIVPLLAFVAAAAPGAASKGSGVVGVAVASAAIVALVFVGRYLLNPLFLLLAAAKAREVLTAAALLVVFGAALLMNVAGLSMALGAFLAGVLLSTSKFRHQLEADVEPFRGILLGLFFLAVGMALDLPLLAANWRSVATAVLAFMAVKALVIYAIARSTKAGHREALDRALLMSQGGEFAFVLYSTAAAVGIIDATANALFTATVIVSMVLTPLVLIAVGRLLPKEQVSLEGVEHAEGLQGRILVIGFGRFGQIATQILLARRCKISIIDNDPDMIRAAERFGFKVYYGDGTRLDILHAAGIERADVVIVCVDKQAETTKIVQLVKHEFPLVKVMARAFDRGHALDLIKQGVDYQQRELFESALVFGGAVLEQLGVAQADAAETMALVRDRDKQRLEAQVLEGLQARRDLLFQNASEAAKEQGVATADATPAP